MTSLCIQCKGRGLCGKPCKILAEMKKFQPKVSLEFSGSAPEIFVGKYGYPNIYAGILAPNEFGSTEQFSMPELWYQNKSSIQEILNFRSRMIYSRFVAKIKDPRLEKEINKKERQYGGRFLDKMQEVALASKAVDASFELKSKPQIKINIDGYVAVIGNPAPLKNITLESNPKVEKKVDYLTNDSDLKATSAIDELYKSGIAISNIIKVLSAGLLGLKIQRKLVPTRWAITATDDTISKLLLQKIKYFPQISDILLFHGDYLGNYYNILLMPGPWSFEVIEASSHGYFDQKTRLEVNQRASQGNTQNNNSINIAMWHDYELFFGRKKYADSVTGAYYANRLGICEYLTKIRKQASCLVMREVREEYWAPCGVGILREVTRDIMNKKPEKFSSIDEAFQIVQTRFKLPIDIYRRKSKILDNIDKQQRLTKFF